MNPAELISAVGNISPAHGVVLVALVLGISALMIIRKQFAGSDLTSLKIQALGMALLIPTILVVAGYGLFESEVGTLLGAVAGYIFGRSSGDDKVAHKPQADKSAPDEKLDENAPKE